MAALIVLADFFRRLRHLNALEVLLAQPLASEGMQVHWLSPGLGHTIMVQAKNRCCRTPTQEMTQPHHLLCFEPTAASPSACSSDNPGRILRSFLACLLLSGGIGTAAPEPQTFDAANADQLEQRGNQLNQRGDLASAMKAWRESLAIRQDLQDAGGAARLTGTIAMAYYEHENYSAATENFRRLVDLTRSLRERRAEGVALTYLGNSFVFLNRYSAAIEPLRNALVVVREFRDQPGEGVVLSALGSAEFYIGRYTESMRSFGTLLALGRALHDEQLIGFATLGIANAADAMGDARRALALYDAALQSARRAKNRRTEGRAQGGIGNVHLGAGDYGLALDHYQRSLKIAQEIHDSEGEANTLGNLGNLYSLTAKPRSAQASYWESLRISSLRSDRQGQSDALNGLGLAAERAGLNNDAQIAYQNAFEAAQQSGNRPAAIIALTNLGGALWNAKKLDQGERTFRQAVQLADAVRDEDLNDMNRVRYFESQLVTYRQLRDVLIARGKPEDALEFSEKGRAQALRVQVAKRVLAEQGRRFQSAEPLTLAEIRALAVTRQLTIVEYALDAKQRTLFTWIVQPDGTITMRRTTLEQTLSELVGAARESFGATGLDRSARARGVQVVADPVPRTAPELGRLYQLLVEPVESLLPKDPKSTVVIIPERELYLVPFAALADTEGQRLIDRHTLLIAPSIEVLSLTRKRQVQTRAIGAGTSLIVGNPTMPQVTVSGGDGPVRLPQLPGTEREAAAIARLVGGRALIADQATKKIVLQQLGGARLVHLATHGLLDDLGSGMPGAIALAPGTDDDGILTAVEIAQLDLRAELVVLSACDTGRGTLTGDGVVGLSRAFLAAGASSTIVSLWQVPDEPTAALMIDFYREMKKGQPKAEALRTAMLATKVKYPDPANWAAFVLVGDGR
jgi:CHAT domain-containing protein